MGLDRYKDFQLEWPDAGTSYPRVFIRPGELERYRATWRDSPVAAGLERYFCLTGDEARAKENLATLQTQLAECVGYVSSTPAMGHHHNYTWIAALADDVLSWPGLPTADRASIRARLALLSYLYVEPDVNSAGNAQHHGNPNMSLARLSDRANFIALLPDHPSFAKWRDYAAAWQAYKLGRMTAPGGGWAEFGSAYWAHGFTRATRGIFGLQAADAPNERALIDYAAPNWDYYLNLLTPYDSRYHARMIPGGANSPPGYTENFLEGVGIFAEPRPELAAELQWAWEANGANTRDFSEHFVALMGRPWVEPKVPELTSHIVPGVGVVFRAHQGPDETYLYLRSGFQWSHWYEDQGHFILHAKGAALVPGQPYQYYNSPDESFDLYNTIRFGDPSNKYDFGWPDSNVIDHAFGPSVDYAWSASGYPDWFIEPGRAAGYGEKRKLASPDVKQAGGFHWNRQVMFLKGRTAQSPNYFVFRDTMPGSTLPSWLNLNLVGRESDVTRDGNRLLADTEWPTKLEVVFARGAGGQFDTLEDEQPLAMAVAQFGSNLYPKWAADPDSISRNWVRKDGQSIDLSADRKPDTEQTRVAADGERAGRGVSLGCLPARGRRGVAEGRGTRTRCAAGHDAGEHGHRLSIARADDFRARRCGVRGYGGVRAGGARWSGDPGAVGGGGAGWLPGDDSRGRRAVRADIHGGEARCGNNPSE